MEDMFSFWCDQCLCGIEFSLTRMVEAVFEERRTGIEAAFLCDSCQCEQYEDWVEQELKYNG